MRGSWKLLFLALALVACMGMETGGSVSPNPLEIMSNVMRRMRAEIGLIAPKDRSHQLAQFKNHVQQIVRVHLVITHGATPPPQVVAKLRAFMKAREHEMERHMHALIITVRQSLGHQKVHLLVKKVREHCNRHIKAERKKVLEQLKVKPKKEFMALKGRWTQLQAKSECHRHGGHLATIVSAEDRVSAMKAVNKAGGRFHVNLIGPHSRHVMWMMPIPRSWFKPHSALRCSEIGRMKNGQVTAVSCDQRQGALCEFLSFNPWVRHVGKKVFFGIEGHWNIKDAKAQCVKYGGRIATIFQHEIKMASHGMATKGPAYIGAWRKHGKAPNESQWFMGAKEPMKFANLRNKGQEKVGHDCMAMAVDGFWDKVPCNKSLSVLCEAFAIHDEAARNVDPHANSKIFVAHNEKGDLFDLNNAQWKCSKIEGNLARIRSNMHQSAALMAIAKNGNRVILDRIRKNEHGEIRWSDETRVSRTQLWRLRGAKMNVSARYCVTLNKVGEWKVESTCDQKFGVLCEFVYRRKHTTEVHRMADFDAHFEMDVDFDLVTRTAEDEARFRRAMEVEVTRTIKLRQPAAINAVTVYLKRGSTVATVRVWGNKNDNGRPEAKALETAVKDGKFAIHVLGRTIRPVNKDAVTIDYTLMICIFGPLPGPHKLIYIVLLLVLPVAVLAGMIALIVCLRKRKRRQQVDAVFTVKKEKELFVEDEKNGVLPVFDPPPPYPQPEEAPPEYSACVGLADKEQKI